VVLCRTKAAPAACQGRRSGWPGVRVFGPSGTLRGRMTWTIGRACTQTGFAGRGSPRRQALNYEMGLGHERFDEAFGAWASDHRYSESNHRRFFIAAGRN